MKFLPLSTLATGLLLISSTVTANSLIPPDANAFLSGSPVISVYQGDDPGKRHSGLRLIPLGNYLQNAVKVASVWKVRNSNDTATKVTLANPDTQWQITYDIPADSSAIFASPVTDESSLHQLLIERSNERRTRMRRIDSQTNIDNTYQLPVTETLDPVLARGLAAWRKKDEIFNGASCANCHSPDGFDLAYFNFDRETILRRAEPHLPNVEDQEAIANLIEYLRDAYAITQPKDPMTFRPFQPGGAVLEGDTRYARDLAFGQQFVDAEYRFTTEPVLSLEEAKLQLDEWMNMDVRKIQLGISMPLWSEDSFHGDQHKSLNDWLPSLPRLPKPNAEAHWYALQDAYLANPTDKNFHAYYDAIDQEAFRATPRHDKLNLTQQPFKGTGTKMALEKFRAVQIASHLFRQEHIENAKTYEARPNIVFQRVADNQSLGRHQRQPMNNPMWEVGDFFRKHDTRPNEKRNSAIELPASPEGLLDTYLPLEQAADEARTSWLTLGWLFDPALAKTGRAGSKMTINGAYFQRTLSSRHRLGVVDDTAEKIGYPIHSAYIFAHKVLGKNYANQETICDPVCETANFSIVSANFLSNNRAVKNLPNNQPEQRAMYIAYTSNIIRMLMYLAEAQFDAQQPIDTNVLEKFEQAKQFLDAVSEENPHHIHDMQLFERITEKLRRLPIDEV